MAVVAVLGLDTLRARFAAAITSFPAQVDTKIQYAGIKCQAVAKQQCPVKTGRLRSSIQYVNNGLMKCTVGTDVFYSIFLEYGHRTRGGGGYVAPRPYLRPGFEAARIELINNLKAIKI